MKQPELFQILQAAPPCGHFLIDGGIEPRCARGESRKRPDQRHIADDIHHLAIDRGGAVGEFVMQRPSGCSQPAMTKTKIPATTVRASAIGRLTVTTNTIAATVATQGGSTFQVNMFSRVMPHSRSP